MNLLRRSKEKELERHDIPGNRYTHINQKILKDLRKRSKPYEEPPCGNGILLDWWKVYDALMRRYARWGTPIMPPLGISETMEGGDEDEG